MTLAEVKLKVSEIRARREQQNPRESFADKETLYSRWVEHPSSSIVHHDAPCCEEARLWFLAYAKSAEAAQSLHTRIKPPHWLGQLFTWGPSPWPIAWCQLPKAKTLDCGVFAALAREVFEAQGVIAHPAQALIRYNDVCTSHWKDLWKNGSKKMSKRKAEELFPWIGDEVVYHEICVLELPGREAKVYDSTFGYWIEPEKREGFRGLLAIRTECPRLLHWGTKVFSCGEWVTL